MKCRKMFELMMMTAKVQSKYFTEDEQKETLYGIFRTQNKVVKKSYTYKNGAVYNGEWKGGFRHGQGTMKWPDGACYEGNWDFGQPLGKGTFHHTDGDVYQGNWSANKANGFGIYTNVKGARYEGSWKDD